MTFFLFIILAYMIGAIPIGKIVATYKGIDIQSTGTGNIGASNVYLVLGKKAGFLVLLGDLGKAYVMMRVSLFFLSMTEVLIVGLFILIGNLKSVFLNFKGGKGVATLLGVLLATEPIAALVCVLFWGTSLVFIKYILIMSVMGTLAVPLTYYRYEHDTITTFCTLVMCLFVLIKHRSNIQVKTRNPQIQKV